MRYLHQVVKGKKNNTLYIHFDKPTKVMVMDSKNFKKYKNSNSLKYYGGFKELGPYEWKVPATGTWHVVVENGTYEQSLGVTASVGIDKGTTDNVGSAQSHHVPA